MDGKHSMRLQNVKVYVWTGPKANSEGTEIEMYLCSIFGRM